ncbi:MAG: hypothetical protein BWK76_02065 [Desulfobulbaceae bacterium A2]|nr:MAG: hypothetical protein BWK76_02065 [Desulfobulbaceae bacterium A2]
MFALDLSVYGGLFFAALLAATILPMQSEALLLGLILGGQQSLASLLAVATAGNTLGSVVNWWLGRSLERFRHHRWFPVSDQALVRAQGHYQRYGRWSLLLSWVPIIGDPLTVVAGLFRLPLLPFLLIVGLAKFSRYLAVALLASLGSG